MEGPPLNREDGRQLADERRRNSTKGQGGPTLFTTPSTILIQTDFPRRAVRKRAATLVIDGGEVYLKRKSRRVKVVQSRKDQLLIVKACHSEPTSGHFGLTKTWKRVAERFYWKGMVSDVHDHVSFP